MKVRIVLTLLICSVLTILLIDRCKPKEKEDKTVVIEKNEYVGGASCKSCHQQQHADWVTSHHSKAMQPATDSSVSGNFNNAVLTADGVTSKFFKKDGKFYINTQGEDGKYADFEVKYTFGYTPLQQYLIEFPGGRMQATRASWDTKNKKWFHQYAGDKIPPGDWLHWTGNGQNWNTMCASCHSTNLQKGYDFTTDTYKTTFNEVNVSCESCHGPGKAHMDYVSSSDFKDGRKIIGSKLHLYKGEGLLQLVNACGNCHGRRVDVTGSVLPGKEYMDDFVPELPTTTYFYADGQMDGEDFNYTSFLQSKMFHRGVECSNCHNPHTAKLKLEGSIVCSQCHASPKYNVPSHTMHADNVIANNCISCHMPSKIYMGNDLRHDHSFRIPRPDLSVQYGTPNTCNSSGCHQNKTAQWAADAIKKNFGEKRRYHFAEDLIPGSKMDDKSEPHLVKLLQDTATPAIVKAAAIDYLGRMATANSGNILIKYLTDNAAIVRYHTLKAMSGYDPALWLNTAAPLLADKVKSVRVAAADLFFAIPSNQIPQEYVSAYNNSKAELQQFITYQTDFAQGNAQAGDFYRRINDLVTAEKFYKRAIQKDDKLSIARINLASTYNELGKNEEALQQLLTALKTEPKSDHIYYNLALLYVELKKTAEAENAFQKAIALHTNNTRVYYNYALFLQQQGKNTQAEKAYSQGLNLEPTNADILYALTVMYIQQQNKAKATETAQKLKQYHGNNPDYQQLFQRLRI